MKRIKEILSCFTGYEKCWLISVLVLSVIMTILFQKEVANGINGKLIMCLYIFDIFINYFSEQYILLVLEFVYFTNTTYGYVKEHPESFRDFPLL